jgi:hypothetical protein
MNQQNNTKGRTMSKMNNKFDELTRGLVQSATRRQALKRFGFGLAGMALACFGLSNTAEAGRSGVRNCFKKCMEACVNSGGTLTYCQTSCTWVHVLMVIRRGIR